MSVLSYVQFWWFPPGWVHPHIRDAFEGESFVLTVVRYSGSKGLAWAVAVWRYSTEGALALLANFFATIL